MNPMIKWTHPALAICLPFRPGARAWIAPSATVLSGDEPGITSGDAAVIQRPVLFEGHVPLRLHWHRRLQPRHPLAGPPHASHARPRHCRSSPGRLACERQNGGIGPLSQAPSMYSLSQKGTYKLAVANSGPVRQHGRKKASCAWMGHRREFRKDVPATREDLKISQTSRPHGSIRHLRQPPPESVLKPRARALNWRPS